MYGGSEAGSYLRLTDFASLNSRLESDTEERRPTDQDSRFRDVAISCSDKV